MQWKNLAAAAALVTGSAGLAMEKCCFRLTAYGGPGGIVRQLSDGQNRIGDDSLPEGTYCLGSNGGESTPFTAALGEDMLTSLVFRRDRREAARLHLDTAHHAVASTLTHDNGDTTFWSCPTGERNGWNIYSKKLAGEPKCEPIWLRADNCYSGCVKTTTTTADCPTTSSKCKTSTSSSKCSKPITSSKCTTSSSSSKCKTTTSSKCTKPTTSSKCSTSTSSSKCKTTSSSSKCSTSSTSSKCKTTSTSSKCTTPTTSSKRTTSSKPAPPPPKTSCKPKESCPAVLQGKNFEFPHLIVPISKSEPNKAYGTVFNGTAAPDVSSVFKFDIPKAAAGKMCELVFYFPKQHQLETSAFELKGEGKFSFHTAYPAASKATTFNNAPKKAYPFGDFSLKPGNGYSIGAHKCPAGEAATFIMSAVGKSYINYFQDYNPCPIGLYIIVS